MMLSIPSIPFIPSILSTHNAKGVMDDLVGLVFIDWLRLTTIQWVDLGLNTASWVWCFFAARTWPSDRRLQYEMLAAGLLLSGLWVVFWNEMTCMDAWMLFKEARYLSAFRWESFVEEVVGRWYVKHQPPFFTFWVSRTPVLWMHQLLFFPWALLCAGVMWKLYGRAAALLLATPVFALMIHQPSNDVLLFGTLLIVLRLQQLSCLEGKHPPTPIKGGIPTPGPSQEGNNTSLLEGKHPPTPLKGGIPTPTPSQADRGLTGNNTSPPLKGRWRRGCGYRLLAALIYGLTWMIKPLTLLTAPCILPQLGIAGFISLAMWGGYVGWSLQREFGRHQLRFLLQQFMITSMREPKGGKIPRVPLTLTATLRKLLRRCQGSLSWRWKHLSHKAVRALPFYLFPVWLQPWTWRGIALAIVIIIGYGNIKYLLLDLLFLFPVHEEIEYR